MFTLRLSSQAELPQRVVFRTVTWPIILRRMPVLPQLSPFAQALGFRSPAAGSIREILAIIQQIYTTHYMGRRLHDLLWSFQYVFGRKLHPDRSNC